MDLLFKIIASISVLKLNQSIFIFFLYFIFLKKDSHRRTTTGLDDGRTYCRSFGQQHHQNQQNQQPKSHHQHQQNTTNRPRLLVDGFTLTTHTGHGDDEATLRQLLLEYVFLN